MSIAESNRPVAKNIDAIINERALSSPEIARRAGMSPRKLRDIVNGNQIIKVNEIKAIAETLGVGVEELFEEGAPMDDYII